MVSARFGDHGPLGLVENVPFAELELRVTVRGPGVVCGWPELDRSVRCIAAEGVPAGMVWGGVANVNTGCVQTRKVCHAAFSRPPSTSPTHTFWFGGPQAALPGSSGSTT